MKGADEVVCMGGGSLLLWLLLRAGNAPRAARKVTIYGTLVLPSPDSCVQWINQVQATDMMPFATSSEWRQQAVLLGMSGRLRRT